MKKRFLFPGDESTTAANAENTQDAENTTDGTVSGSQVDETTTDAEPEENNASESDEQQ